ncbi:MAG: sugar phosphate isomerase/epimerase [Verrucomicrobia bacterium]|nr:sugar phosphate isomerase/epimerase [Verrucomicrobiota bacterium]
MKDHHLVTTDRFVPAAHDRLAAPMQPRPLTRRQFIATAGGLGLAASTAAAAEATATAPDPLAPWQIGCYTRPWDAWALEVALDGIAEAGYRYAGLMTAKGKSWVVVTSATTVEEASRIGAEVRQRGLELVSVYGDLPFQGSVPDGVVALRRLLDACAACGSPGLMLGGVAEERLGEPYWTVIRESCGYARERGVGLTIKPHGGLNATGPQCRKAIERVGHPNFRLWYDPGNIFYYSNGQLDPVDDAGTVDGLVAGVSVKDYRHPKDVAVTPGTGQVRFAEVFARLQRGGFTRGPLVVECTARGDVRQVTAAARQARQFVEALLRDRAPTPTG